MSWKNRRRRKYEQKLKTCRTKRRYKDKRVAAWKSSELRGATGMSFRHYKCEECGFYHLTSHPKAVIKIKGW